MIQFLFCIALAFALTPAFAEPVTLSRIHELPSADQVAWKNYWERSQTNAQTNVAAVQAEVVANKMTNALRAPSGGDFKVHVNAGDPWFAGDEAKRLADAILSYQTPSGGWSKHLGFTHGLRQPGMQWTSQNEPGQPAHYVATFDNGSTTEEIFFLANVWQATKREDCKAAVIKGLNFIFAAQFPNGGWPQVYPLEGGYHDDITFNDDAMTHVLELLQSITENQPYYAFLNDAQRAQTATALAKGIQCVLKTQVAQNGTKTVWCAQNDALTLQPATARKMEPATLSGLESAHILKFLMTITNPTPEVVTCIEAGLKWLENAKITGIGTTKNEKGKTIYVADPNATEVRWARFYNLTTGKPVFPGRDGVQYETFAAMSENNKLGYDYYTSQPGSIVGTSQKKWRKLLAKQSGK
jgi:PelA/Pel-15E family pectate lyase